MRRLLVILFLFLPIISFSKLQGKAYIDSLLQQLPNAINDTNKVKLLDRLSGKYWAYDPDKGLAYAQQELALAEKLGWNEGKGLSYYDLALNYRYKSEYQKALQYCDKARQIWQDMGQKDRIGYTYSMQSIIFIDQSDYPTALDYGFKALNIYNDLHDTASISKTLTNIGIIYEDLGDHGKAMEFHTRALKISEALNDKNGIAIDLSNIGLVYKEQKDYKNALDCQFRALKICQELGSNNVLSKVLGYIGDAYDGEKEYSKALEYLFEAKKIDEQMGNKAGLAEKFQNIGLTYLAITKDSTAHLKADQFISASKQRNLDSAIEYFSRAAVIHKDIGNLKDLSENYGDLAIAKEIKGDYREALEDHKQYMITQDSFSNTVKTKQLNELQTKYETKVKDKQIDEQKKQILYDRKISISLAVSSVLLLAIGIIVYLNQRKTNRLNTQITIQKQELEKLNNVKDRIFSVISHDLRTPVNSLISFTQLLENSNIPPEKLQKYAAILKGNLGYTAGLMENLLNWARTQMHGYKPVFEKFDISETTAQTVALLMQEATNKEIDLVNHVPSGTTVFADINMTLLLIRNLVSNAIKYTPKKGAITVTAQTNQYKVCLQVKDTGIGISKELVNEFNDSLTDQPIDSTPGTNKEKGTGLGLMLCKGFAGLMHGKIILESEPGKGSSFTVELPA